MPSSRLARSRRPRRIMAEISCGRYSCSPSLTLTSWPILRLIDLMVRSGASTHWFLAALPTSNRPSSDRPTNDGRIGSPSSAQTCGWPSRTKATSLLVVPRSIPTIGSIVASPSLKTAGPSRLGDPHLRVAEDPAVPQVAAADLFDHLAGGAAGVEDGFHHFHRFRVEGLSHDVQGLQPVLAQRPLHALQAHCIPRDQGYEPLPHAPRR